MLVLFIVLGNKKGKLSDKSVVLAYTKQGSSNLHQGLTWK